MEIPSTKKQAILILNGISQVGPVTYGRLMEAFGDDPMRVFQAQKCELKKVEGVGDVVADTIINWKTEFDVEAEERRLAAFGATFVTRECDGYPPLLKEIYDPPLGLYCWGEYRPSLRTIAIVGSRRSTLYGLAVAKRFGKELAQMGFCVVSGMARGIDSAAHEGALEGGGKTVAILGCGVDIIYPPENKDLYDKIKESGVVMSEFSLGRKADKRTFPMRNRIISGIAQAVVVVETNSNGGSMITARMAGEQGRHVFAVPGRIDQTSSKGCHELMRDGASLCSGVEVILEELNYLGQLELGLEGDEKKEDVGLEGGEKEIMKCLRDGSILGIDQITEQTKLSTEEVASGLMMLELKRLLVKRADGKYEAVSLVAR